MADYWYAECIPCGWQEPHTTQDEAIRAAEDHVYEKHRRVPAAVRWVEKIGHVQNRSENALSTTISTPVAEDAASGDKTTEPSGAGDDGGASLTAPGNLIPWIAGE